MIVSLDALGDIEPTGAMVAVATMIGVWLGRATESQIGVFARDGFNMGISSMARLELDRRRMLES